MCPQEEQDNNNNNNNNKAKLRPALYVRTNAGKKGSWEVSRFEVESIY
jgi:hypothetical protein